MEYLSNLINWIFQRSTPKPKDIKLKQKLLNCLQQLKDMKQHSDCTAEDMNYKADEAIYLIFYVGKSRIQLTEKEKKQFAELLVDTFRYIHINIEFTFYMTDFRLSNAKLMKRSALQYLIEDFANFPAGNTSTLKAELEKANIKKTIDIMDYLIEMLYDSSDSECSDREAAGASEVPDTHVWW